MKKLGVGIIAVLSIAILAACGNSKETSSSSEESPKIQSEDISALPLMVKNDSEAIEGGTLEVAVVMDTQFQGLFQKEFYQDNYDAQFMLPSNENLFLTDKDFKIVDGGAANLDLDSVNQTATITLRENLKWSDGEAVTADDVIFSYEVIGHPEYTGIRYDNNFTNIIGMDAYHNGTENSISGITKKNDQTVVIEYKEVHPGMLQAGGGVWASALPKHTFDGIPIKDMQSSDQVRKHPVVFGPYYMSTIVSDEFVEYLPNDYYYGGKPKMDKLIFKSVSTTASIESMNTKQFDLFLSMPADMSPSYQEIDGYQLLGRQEQAYTYIGFKLGTWNEEENHVEYNPESKMADKALRQAMGYALDNDVVGGRFYNGLRSKATTLIPPVFRSLHDETLAGYTLDLDKANQLLDDAGYADIDNDGIRENKEGEELIIRFAAISDGETAQLLADYYVQLWKSIGLDVRYTTDRLLDFQVFYDKLKNDNAEIDVYQGAWNTGADPSPTSLYGPNSAFNFSRFESDKNTELLAAIDSDESFDEAKRKDAFDAWQAYAKEEAFVIPTLYRTEVLPISNRVKDFDWSYDVEVNPWVKVAVTDVER